MKGGAEKKKGVSLITVREEGVSSTRPKNATWNWFLHGPASKTFRPDHRRCVRCPLALRPSRATLPSLRIARQRFETRKEPTAQQRTLRPFSVSAASVRCNAAQSAWRAGTSLCWRGALLARRSRDACLSFAQITRRLRFFDALRFFHLMPTNERRETTGREVARALIALRLKL